MPIVGHDVSELVFCIVFIVLGVGIYSDFYKRVDHDAEHSFGTVVIVFGIVFGMNFSERESRSSGNACKQRNRVFGQTNSLFGILFYFFFFECINVGILMAEGAPTFGDGVGKSSRV